MTNIIKTSLFLLGLLCVGLFKETILASMCLLPINEIIGLIFITVIGLSLIGFTLYLIHVYCKENSSEAVDQDIPLILIGMPILLFFVMIYYKSFFFAFVVSMILHLCVCGILRYLKGIRKWQEQNINPFIIKKKMLYLYFEISIALIYVYFWVIFISAIRYLNMGRIFDTDVSMDNVLNIIFAILVFLPAIICILISIIQLKDFLWKNTAPLFLACHIRLIQNSIYFKICEKIYKYTHIFVCYLSLHGPNHRNYKNSNIIEKLTDFFYWRAYIFDIMILLIIPIEIYFFNYLHLWYYVGFYYFIVRAIFFACWSLYSNSMDWDKMCCLSDYCYNNLITPHYPKAMWDVYFDEPTAPTFWFGFTLDHTENELLYFEEQRNKFRKTIKKCYPPKNVINYQNYYTKINVKLNASTIFPRYLSIQAKFRSQNLGIRWTHTQTLQMTKNVINNPGVPILHNGVGYVVINFLSPMHKLSLLNISGWQNYKILITPPHGTYTNYNTFYPEFCQELPTAVYFKDFYEQIFLGNFYNSNLYTKICLHNEKLHYNLKLSQSSPDLIVKDQFGMDLKTGGQIRSGQNTIIITSEKKYMLTLRSYKKVIEQEYKVDISLDIKKLEEIFYLPQHERIDAWDTIVQNMLKTHNLSETSLPPLILDNFVSETNLLKEQQTVYSACKEDLFKISDLLVKKGIKNIPFPEGKKFSQSLLDDGFAQQLKGMLTNFNS